MIDKFQDIHIDSPEYSDNRRYDYTHLTQGIRAEYPYIVDMVHPNSTVVDLGCGNGELLSMLIKEKNVKAKGVEISPSGVLVCKKKNLDVIEGSIDAALPFSDNEFDFSICNVTIQMLLYPEMLLKEMKRISNYQIVSFPNFGFFKNRISFLFTGNMPEHMLFGYKWYNTGHIHQLSFNDFLMLIDEIKGLKIIRHEFIHNSKGWRYFLMKNYPNLFQGTPILLLEAE